MNIDYTKSSLLDSIIQPEQHRFEKMCNHLITSVPNEGRFYFDHAMNILKEGGYDNGYTITVVSILLELGLLNKYAQYNCTKCGSLQRVRKDYRCRNCGHFNEDVTFSDLIFYFKKRKNRYLYQTEM